MAEQKNLRPVKVLESLITEADSPRDFAVALRRETVALIAEVKKASPSKGVLIEDFLLVEQGVLREQETLELFRSARWPSRNPRHNLDLPLRLQPDKNLAGRGRGNVR